MINPRLQQPAISLGQFNLLEKFVYGVGKDDYDLTVSPSPDVEGTLVVTHSHSGRVLLTVPPIVPARTQWVGVAGAAINDWVRGHGKDKAHRLLCDLANPAPRRDGIRTRLARLWARLFHPRRSPVIT